MSTMLADRDTSELARGEDEISNLVNQVNDLNKQLKLARKHECELEAKLKQCQKRTKHLQQVGKALFRRLFKILTTKGETIQFN